MSNTQGNGPMPMATFVIQQPYRSTTAISRHPNTRNNAGKDCYRVMVKDWVQVHQLSPIHHQYQVHRLIPPMEPSCYPVSDWDNFDNGLKIAGVTTYFSCVFGVGNAGSGLNIQ
ncbi:uncharacterized protein LOC116137169 [Pistacia vera]|uniref:uncharacterized protein LOC116137169 n=1 Tax=Pistacia vera TaxID=55513 RepID=UPI001263B9DB|nr:uncharacterized protein LOC116137169 [Pistacia vera]